MTAQDRYSVLCVDDEQQVLEGLALHLRRRFVVHTATSGDEGLEVLERDGPFAVVMSDMRMPKMNGATFLARVRLKAPDTIRMLLTGFSDLDAAIAAVNEGQIFRFLTKPCPPAQLIVAFKAAIDQYRLITAERVLLEETLHGSINVLTDILSLNNPAAFGRANRLKNLVVKMADELALTDRWQVEVAAMLSQLGSIMLPSNTVQRYYAGDQLTDEEREQISRLPKVASKLLKNIPRLEEVRSILSSQTAPLSDTSELPEAVRTGARMLRIAMDFDELDAQGVATQLALDTMQGRSGYYDPELLRILATLKGSDLTEREIRELPLSEVEVDMVIAEDIKSSSGALLVARGYVVTPRFIERVAGLKNELAIKNVRVVVPKHD